jgi:O-antigen ligase
VCGGAVVLQVAGPRRVLVAVVGPGLGAAVACVGLAPGLSVDRSEQPAAAVVGLLVGLGIAAASTRVPAVVQRRVGTTVTAVVVAMFVLGTAVFRHSRSWSSDRLSLTSTDRRGTNAAAFDVLRDHALVGVGPGDLRVVFPTPGGLVTTTLVHNEYLQLAVEIGVVGVALAAACALLTVRRLAATRHRCDDRWMWDGAVAAFTALAVHSAFDFLWHIPAVVLLVTAIVALGCGPASSVPNTNHERHHT